MKPINKKKYAKVVSKLMSSKLNQEDIKHDKQILMYRFLSEIDRVAEEKGIVNRKDLASMLGTSASYITQLYKGSKPLNFETVAKAQAALNIKFEICAINKLAVNKGVFIYPNDIKNFTGCEGVGLKKFIKGESVDIIPAYPNDNSNYTISVMPTISARYNDYSIEFPRTSL
jgi:hypothetical protein